VFVTGQSAGRDGYLDYATAAYDASTGAELWVKRYGGPGNTGKGDGPATALGVSPDGSTVFVTGTSPGGAADYATLAYRASDGKQIWVSLYMGPAGGPNEAAALAVSPDGSKVFVTGASYGLGDDYATVAYDASTGAELWVERYNKTADEATAIGVSPDGSMVFVTGRSVPVSSDYYDDYVTVAYRATNGAQLWVKRYHGQPNQDDRATALKVSPDGSKVFVTGHSHDSMTHLDYATVAYDAATGAELWVGRYDGPAHGDDFATALGVSPDGSQVFVTGGSTGSSYYDYATVAYGASSGTRLWVKRHDHLGELDVATGLAVSPDGSEVLVTGHDVEYATLAYNSSTGAKLWLARYPKNQGAGASTLALSPDGCKVFVTGDVYSTRTYDDYGTVAYRTTLCPS
jgi:WD40 repeat protein